MIVCPNCDHHNPEGATQCEACYTPLPEMMPCPNCGAQVQVDANFCGQCGFNIQSAGLTAGASQEAMPTAMESPSLPPPFPGLELEPNSMAANGPMNGTAGGASGGTAAEAAADLDAALDQGFNAELDFEADLEAALEASAESGPTTAAADLGELGVEPTPQASSSQTQLQRPLAKMLHIRSNVTVDLPESLSVVHIGKANDRIPPDIDVSGFPDSEVVSRVHADIRVEGDAYYIEDLGSSNGTYVNNLPLMPGNRHRLRVGDRISLGKGDLVTFLFQVA
jgi:ribosomal protein L40E